MGNEYQRRAALEELVYALFALARKIGVADRHHFVHKQYFRLDGGGNPEAETGLHAGRVRVDGRVDERTDVRKTYDVVHERVHFVPRPPLEDAVQDYVLAPGKFGAEACAQGQHHGDAATDLHLAGIALVYAADYGKRRRFAAAVVPD